MYKPFKTLGDKVPNIAKILTLRGFINPTFLQSAYSQSKALVTEEEIMAKLRETFPEAKSISVEDTSGGCGAMFNVSIETNEFKGLSIMKQHRMVYDTLKEQIQSIHGLHLETKASKQ